MVPDEYLARIGLDSNSVDEHSVETLASLQRAHVLSVPFENLAIVGDPFEDETGPGVTLELPALYEKMVERERGGYCFELNGLFGWLLAELGFDSRRIAARVLGDDGGAYPPANHHTHVVSLDRRYVVDVGLGGPRLRRPLPLDGSSKTDDAGITWRIVESDRPDADYLTQFRERGEIAWTDRYVFRDRPRELRFFEATCEYLATAPESPFTDEPIVSIGTPTGRRKLSRDEHTVHEDGESWTTDVSREEWYDVLQAEFGVTL